MLNWLELVSETLRAALEDIATMAPEWRVPSPKACAPSDCGRHAISA